MGLAWFEITVHGLHHLRRPRRHRLPYRNAITAAGEVVAKLEEWFPKYSAGASGRFGCASGDRCQHPRRVGANSVVHPRAGAPYR